MEITVLDQTMNFLYSSLTGFTLGFIYDFFMCVKLTIFKNRIIRDIIDILFVFFCAAYLIVSFFNICGLSFRFYHILGFFLGAVIYFSSINRVIYKIFEKILIIFIKILKILLYPVKIFSTILSRIFCLFVKLLGYPVGYIKYFFIKIIHSIKNVIKIKKKV